jgi:hypothetical protein
VNQSLDLFVVTDFDLFYLQRWNARGRASCREIQGIPETHESARAVFQRRDLEQEHAKQTSESKKPQLFGNPQVSNAVKERPQSRIQNGRWCVPFKFLFRRSTVELRSSTTLFNTSNTAHLSILFFIIL